ncbi:MAG: SRPBCC domain-containing protein [Rubrivivax sp.]|nr:SRPBCC domain-containing protein [Rubrivivax sp.]
MAEASTEGGDAVFRIFIRADIQRVWRELTKTGEAQGAVFNAWLHTTGLVPGGRLQMRTGSGKYVIVDGDVVAFEPPHRFVHTHRFTQYDDPVCQVSYELKPVGQGADAGVEVTLRVIGLPPGTKTGKSMASGGHMILDTLKAICETGRPSFGTRLMYGMFARMEFVLPARTRAEHWPLQRP